MKIKYHKKSLILEVLFLSVLGILFLSAIVFFSKPALAQQGPNWAASANGATVSLGSSSGSAQGSLSNINDENTSTYYGRTNSCYAEGSKHCTATAYFTAEITFANTVPILNKIDYNLFFSITSALPWDEYTYAYIYVHQNGNWVKVATANSSGSVTGSWQNVDKIRAYVYASIEKHSGAHFHAGYATATARLYEIKAWGGPSYIDIGLRVYNGTQTVAIAAEPTGTLTSPLRIAKNGVVYGIVLVNPGDPNDSGVRIRTSSGVKALRKYP